MKFTVTFEVPDGTTFRVEPTEASGEFVPPFEDQLVPLPPSAIPIPSDPQPYRAAATVPVAVGLCPVHREPWKTVPAGISKKTGQPYNAFQTCPVRGCPQRPAA